MMGRGGFALLLILHIAEGDGGDFLMGQGSKVGIRSDAASDLLARAAQENAQGGGVKYGPECQVCGGACGSETTRCPRCWWVSPMISGFGALPLHPSCLPPSPLLASDVARGSKHTRHNTRRAVTLL